MQQNILIPLEVDVANATLESSVTMFEHIDEKRFTGFFVEDFVLKKPKKEWPDEAVEKLEIISSLEAAAGLHNIHFCFLPADDEDVISLACQSRYADLMLLDEHCYRMFTENPELMNTIACPVMVPAGMGTDFDEVYFIFTEDLTELTAIKSFLTFFHPISRNKKVTIITVDQDNGGEISSEKGLVDYLKNFFSDVGVFPLNAYNFSEKIWIQLLNPQNKIVIMGKKAYQLLFKADRLTAAARQNMTIYFSNF